MIAMKKINKLSFILAFLLSPVFINAQILDERQREASTIIADVLNELPADNDYHLYKAMEELCRTGKDGLKSLALMLKPIENGSNAPIEYALDGLSHYVSSRGGMQYYGTFAKAMTEALEQTQDKNNKLFLISLFKNFGNVQHLETLANYLYDEDLAMTTMMTIMSIPDSDEFIANRVMNEQGDKETLAYAVAYKNIASVEGELISWLPGSDESTKTAVYFALSKIGTSKSLPVLKENAKIVKYQNDPTDVTNAYVNVVLKLATEKDTANVVKESKTLLKVKRSNVVIAALNANAALYGRNAVPTLLKYVKHKDAQIRNEALNLLKPYANEQLFVDVIKVAKKDDVKADVIRWLSNFNAKSQMEFIAKQANTKNENLAEATIRAMCLLADEDQLTALFPLADERFRDVMVDNLKSYKGSPYKLLVKCLEEGDDEQKITALTVVSQRRMYSMYVDVFTQCVSEMVSDPVRKMAFVALKNVVRTREIPVLQSQLVITDDIYVEDVQNALITLFSNKDSFNPQVMNSFISFYQRQNPSVQARFYPIFASNEKFITRNLVLDAYNEGVNEKEALNALLSMDHESMMNVLFDMAKDDELNKNIILKRYVYLVNKYEKSDVTKITSLKKALELKPDDEVINYILNAVETTNSYQGIMLAADYLDNPNTIQTAANVILNIAYRNPEYNATEVVELLERIRNVFADSDAIYKKAQIEEHLTKIAKTPVFTLSEEEQKDGFVILFDGTNLDKWIGDKTNYIVKNGNIYVTADYGNDGNLYTDKEYSDFIYRFEFCYLKPGVNNGVGVRTPMNVDAAYQGMEIQILDHDAPIYQGLRDYQVHGSVYGIIPAERLVFPELGTWNTEEIILNGDYVKVTVNDQVILEGDIRKACKGHNVAPDGSEHNPYTVDKHNHPGLFNEKGYISFCGHGEGLLIRNVRIKEL